MSGLGASLGGVVAQFVLLLASSGLGLAQSEGVQILSDGVTRLVTKDVGEERWSITRHADGTTSGVVYSPDGSAPSFVDCRPIVTEAPSLSCWAAPPCDAWPCHGEWSFAGEVELPAGFFDVPGAAVDEPFTADSPLTLADLAGTYELAGMSEPGEGSEPVIGEDQAGILILARSGAFLWRINTGLTSLDLFGAHGTLAPTSARGFDRKHFGGFSWQQLVTWLDGPVRPVLSRDTLDLPQAFAVRDIERANSTHWRSLPFEVSRDSPATSTAGVQRGRRGDYRLISKTVGAESWSILRREDVVSGTVYYADGRAPAFVECTAATVAGGVVELACAASAPCREAPCEEAWTPLRAVELPASFFEPPAAPVGGAPDPLASVLADVAGTYWLEPGDPARYLSGSLQILPEGHVLLSVVPYEREFHARHGVAVSAVGGSLRMVFADSVVMGPGRAWPYRSIEETWTIAREGDTLTAVGMFGEADPLVWTRAAPSP